MPRRPRLQLLQMQLIARPPRWRRHRSSRHPAGPRWPPSGPPCASAPSSGGARSRRTKSLGIRGFLPHGESTIASRVDMSRCSDSGGREASLGHHLKATPAVDTLGARTMVGIRQAARFTLHAAMAAATTTQIVVGVLQPASNGLEALMRRAICWHRYRYRWCRSIRVSQRATVRNRRHHLRSRASGGASVPA